MRRCVAVWFAALALLVLPDSLFAQGDLGALTGSVTDPSGAVVPDASITITNVATGVKWTAKSSSAGYYRVPVPPGTYRVEATREGFKTAVTDNVEVPVAQVVTVDFSVQVGTASQSVTITETAPLQLTTATAEVGSSVSPQEFETLPIEVSDGGRQLQTFIFTSLPGTVGDTFSGSINGGQLFSHEILIDGVTIGRYDLSGGSLDEFSPGTDSIGEFKVQMTNYSAEYGETGGGIANFVMKSGTNQIHGTAFEYNKNPVFNATGLLNNAFGTPKHNEKENNFGGTVGGPIRKDRTFFFASYEGDRFRSFNFSGLVTIPTPAMLKGDFGSWLGSQIGTDALGRPVFKNEIYDPTTTRTVNGATVRDPFDFNGQLNVIPPSEFSKASSVLLPLFPAPFFAKNINNVPRFSGCCPELRRDAWSVKMDHVINEKQKLTGSFTSTRRQRFNRNGSTFPPFPGQPLNAYKTQIVGGPQARLSHSWSINDHSINELSVGYNRFNNVNNVTNNKKFTPQLGIPGIPNDCFPPLSFKGHNPFISVLGVGCEGIDPSESYVYSDTYSTVHGKHSLKVGGEFRRYRYNTFEPGSLSGSFHFSDRETSLPGFTSKTGHPFASFILGAVDSGSKSVYTTEPGYRAGLFAFFAQDDLKATSKLTLNIGLRWEIPLPKKEAFNRQSGFDPTVPNPGADNIPGALVFLGSCSTCIHRSSFQDWYFKEFGPRLGLAYQISSKMVFRGGYGISFSPPILNNFGSQNLFGFNAAVSLPRGTSPTGFSLDPVTYWTPLASAPLPAAAQIGVPAFTGTLPSRDPALANGNGLDFLPRTSAAQPYTQNWSAGFQYQFPREVLLEANYVGSKGTRLLDSLFSNTNNQVPDKYIGLGDILTDDLASDLADPVNGPILASYGVTQLPYPSFESTNFNPTVAQALRPFPQYDPLSNNYPAMGSSTYHSLQLMVRKRSAHGLTFIAAYTLSKTLANTDSALYYPTGGFGYTFFGQDFYNRKGEKSIASFDFPQVLKLTWIYNLPFGRGQRWMSSSGGLDYLVGGWKVTAIQQYRSGQPLSIIDSSLCTGLYSGAYGDGCSVRADVVAGVKQTVPLSGLDVINGTPFLNPAAFVDPPVSGNTGNALRFGTAPRLLPNVRAPAAQSEDFGFIKDTRVSERCTLQIRGDFFNVFNRTGRGYPDVDLADGYPAGGGTFGLILGPAHGPRLIQLAIRLNF